MFRKPVVIVYRHSLLSFSETFVKSQAEALQSFTPYYVGSRFVQGLSLPRERTLTVNQGGLIGRFREVSSKLRGFAPNFTQQIRYINPKLIHAHFGPDGAMILPLAENLRIPLLVTFHGADITVKHEYAKSSFSYRIYLRRLERLKHEARLFIAVSEFIKNKLLEQGFPPEKILVHYIGVDTELFQCNPSIQREPIVLFVGRLVEKKGCKYLIRAMSKVQAAVPEINLLVIGDGFLRPHLEQLARKMLRRYEFLGVQSHESVRVWMQRAKVFCVPSITAKSGDSEGFGLVFAEAQAMGLPVVSFASGGVPEAVSHGETGFLATERDSDGLSAYILHLLKDETLYQQFSQKAQARVLRMFNLQNQTHVLEKIYVERVLQKANIINN